jgi:hypothetical protein
MKLYFNFKGKIDISIDGYPLTKMGMEATREIL